METSTIATGSEGAAASDRLIPPVRGTTSRALAALRRFRAWVVTPVMVRREARIGPDGSVGDETGWADYPS